MGIEVCSGAAGAAAGLGGGAGGVDMSKRSPILLAAAGGLLVEVTGEAAEEKSPKSPPKLSLRGTGAGGDVGFAGAAGFMSKKEPPLRDDLFVDACRE